MAANKRLTDLIDYTSVLPYASEMFGIYQPLLGWKSKRVAHRFSRGNRHDQRRLIERLKAQFTAELELRYDKDCGAQIALRPGASSSGKPRSHDGILLQRIAEKLPPQQQMSSDQWSKLINRERIESLLSKEVAKTYADYYAEQCRAGVTRPSTSDAATGAATPPGRDRAAAFRTALESRLRDESAMGGVLLHLADHKQYAALDEIFYKSGADAFAISQIAQLVNVLGGSGSFLDIEHMDPQDQSHIRSVALSPISVVHLFRQYFFELDTFLGTPVGHVWLSPGSTVELVEAHTRRTLIEKTLEEFQETVTKAESETTNEEEISEAIKEDNKQDIKFGQSVTASYASVSATSNFDFGTSQQSAREETHKRSRKQTERLATEIRKNFKSTFKTVTEVTDTSSKRYVLTNTTGELLNYELRRKMRQVAVQVQDIGSYLCWQAYVDRPGESLGVAKLMHIAKPAELDGLHAPDEIPLLQPFSEEKVVTLPFISKYDSDADNEGEVYKDGVEVDDSEEAGNLEIVESNFPIECVCPKSDYVLADVEFDGLGKPVAASRKGDIANVDNKATFTLHLNSVDFQGQNSVQVKLSLLWTPGPNANDDIVIKNRQNQAQFKAKERAAHEKAYVETAKERITLSHGIKSRFGDELREEERIVIYRQLIQELLMHGVNQPDDHTRHVVSELINSMFDIDKMLYFVAPEWWRPRFRVFAQQLEAERSVPAASIGTSLVSEAISKNVQKALGKSGPDHLRTSTVGWGGVDESQRDNYFITEESLPARFGSSLGWLLQLDGDNMRNAFLNAPWVKTVIPIRPGKEQAAINWLKGVEGFNGIGNSDIYRTNNPNEKDINGNPLDGQKMIDVIMDLARKVERKHEEGIKTGQFPRASEVADPTLVDAANVVTATPIDRVYEHGFYPLQGGFRANVQDNYEIFDQWLEILPTDQVVPVEVKYDPRTGRQIP